MEVWYHPSCSKSRAATKALDEAGVVYTTRRYLEDSPTETELVEVLDRLGLEPWEIARTKEKVAGKLGLAGLPRDAGHRDTWLRALVEHPVLIQRPILTAADGTTVVGRDRESVQQALDAENR